MKIYVINGPNLNMLEKREKDHYGGFSLNEIKSDMQDYINNSDKKFVLDFFQSNSESEIIEKIHDIINNDDAMGIIINAGAFTHTSIAIMDALKMVKAPVIEVHISNIFRREDFRHKSYISYASTGVISGFGKMSYLLALQYLISNN